MNTTRLLADPPPGPAGVNFLLLGLGLVMLTAVGVAALAAALGFGPSARRDGLASPGQVRRRLGTKALVLARPELRPGLVTAEPLCKPTAEADERCGSLVVGTDADRPAPPRNRTLRVGEVRIPCTELGYLLGHSVRPRGPLLWSRLDRSTRVIGPMGSGKTMRLLAPALRDAPGAALATSTKPDLYELTAAARRRGGRPIVVLDPWGLVPGAEPLAWSPIHGASDPRVAETRARAFTTVARAGVNVTSSDGALFHKSRAGTMLMCLLHAAALDGADLPTVLRWATRPTDPAIARILDNNPNATPGWAEKFTGLLAGDPRTLGNTLATLEQALSCYDHPDVAATATGTGTDLRELISSGGTVYALGKDHPYSSIAPLVTAICEDVLDTAETHAARSPRHRCDPPFLAVLDEAPNIAPLPSLARRVADGRGRGIAVIYATQAWASVVARWGNEAAAELAAYTTNTVVHGGIKDPDFLTDMEKLCGQREVIHRNRTHPTGLAPGPGHTTTHHTWEPVLRAHQIAQLDTTRGEALVLAEDLPPILARQPGSVSLTVFPAASISRFRRSGIGRRR
ncbi:MAG TPA: TraM recognition domain-containing protein [Sporichthyaceae bacterium]|nr:TraM recognition domain-containing protein [Sporichthyaceae bacterium]